MHSGRGDHARFVRWRCTIRAVVMHNRARNIHRIMKDGRKTTFEERVEIASYCIAHDHNYAETAEKYKVSYQQARSYTVKYEEGGVDALQDRRGKRKDVDSLSEIERLKAELKLEKAKRIRAEMEVSFLKKLEEIERRRR